MERATLLLLSRGDIKEAIAMVTTRWGKCEVRTMDEEFLRSTGQRVREATLHEYDGWDWRGRERGEGKGADFARRTAFLPVIPPYTYSMSDWTIGTLKKGKFGVSW